jgi:DNA-binding PadR family transcriptional regulator
MHGYALIEHMREASGGHLDYPEGTIYPALRRLEDQGFVRSRWSDSDGRRRRVYSLTPRGVRSLENHRSEWDRYVGSVRAILGHG